jgi:hypothetical protein
MAMKLYGYKLRLKQVENLIVRPQSFPALKRSIEGTCSILPIRASKYGKLLEVLFQNKKIRTAVVPKTDLVIYGAEFEKHITGKDR